MNNIITLLFLIPISVVGVIIFTLVLVKNSKIIDKYLRTKPPKVKVIKEKVVKEKVKKEKIVKEKVIKNKTKKEKTNALMEIKKDNKKNKVNEIIVEENYNGDGFTKFKKKILLEVLIKTIILSLCIGIIIVSAPLLYFKIREIKSQLLVILLIGVTISVITFVLLYLILRPNDKQIAKRLDNELNLNEKVLTMLEYKDQDNIIINLQRADTEYVLRKTPLKKLTIKFSVSILVIMILSISLGITALAYPNPVDEVITGPTETDKKWESDDWTKNAIYTLIQTVKDTDFNEELKTKYVAKLEELLESIDTIKTENKLVETIKGIIEYNEVEMDKINTNNEIYKVLVVAENSKITDLAGQINFLNPEKVELALDNFIILINGNSDAINEFDREFSPLLKESELDKNDELYKLLVQLANDLYQCQFQPNINNAVKTVIDKASKPIVEQIVIQKANKDINVFIKEELISIFGLENYFKNDIFEGNQNGAGSSDGPTPQLPTGGTGGYDNGEFVVASDDECFDPEKGTVKYGDVIDAYNGAIAGLFKDEKLPEEYEEFFEKYYGILYGTKDENE